MKTPTAPSSNPRSIPLTRLSGHYGQRQTLWCVFAVVIGSIGLLLALYAMRHRVAEVLRAPYPCGHGSGCVDVAPLFAAAVMFGFDALVLAFATWQFRSGSFAEAPQGSGFSRVQWRVGLGLILASGLAVRLMRLDLAQWHRDEAMMAWLAIGGLQKGQLPLTGIDSSIQIPNPPASVYFLAPVLTFFLDRPGGPPALIVFQAVFSTITALMCAWFVRRWTGSTSAGLAAGCAYALGFWAVFRGRQIWPPNFLPPFVLLYLDALLLLAIRRQGRALAWALAWLALMLHLHYLSITLAPLLLLAAWMGRRTLGVRHVAAGVGLCMLLMAPFLYWEASFDTLFRDVKEFARLSGRSATLDISSIRFVLNLSSAGSADGYIEPHGATLSPITTVPLQATGLGTFLMATGLLACIAGTLKPQRPGDRVLGIMLAGWVFAPALLLLRHSVPLAQVYFHYLLPAPAVLIGLGLRWTELRSAQLSKRLMQAWSLFGTTLLALYLVGSMLILDVVLLVAERAPTTHYGVPVGVLHEAGNAAYRAWRTSSDAEPLFVGGHWEDVEKMRLAMGAAVPAIVFDDCRELPAPNAATRSAIYFLVDYTPVVEYLLNAEGAKVLAAIPRHGAAPYRVFLVDAATARNYGADGDLSKWPDCAGKGHYVSRNPSQP